MYTLRCIINATPVKEAIQVPISGLVITLDGSPEDDDQTIAHLKAESAIEIGVRSGHKCAIVIDSPSKDADQKLFTWVRDLPGVADVQVAFVGFDDSPDDASTDQHSTLPDSTG